MFAVDSKRIQGVARCNYYLYHPIKKPTFVSNEFKKLMPHPDGDLHTMLNAWNAATWLQQLTRGMETEPATRI